MSRARHMKRASGGAVAYAGGSSNVMKEAHERKRGGRVHHAEGEEHKGKHDRRARGGSVGAAAAPGRKRGGGIGSDKRPLSSAATISHIKGEEAGTESMEHEGSKVPNP